MNSKTATPEEWRAYMKARRRRLLDEMIAHMGGVCAGCGGVSNLEIHHKNPEEKSFDPSRANRAIADMYRELEKCELLCETCHKKQHATTHGQGRMYEIHGCRCDLCVENHRIRKKAFDKRYVERVKKDPVRRQNYLRRAAINMQKYRDRKKQQCQSRDLGFV